jgi:ribosome maturation factor RimP
MKYYLEVPEDTPGQEIFRPEHYKIESGERVEVDKNTYDSHHDRDVFVSDTENEKAEDSTNETTEE